MVPNPHTTVEVPLIKYNPVVNMWPSLRAYARKLAWGMVVNTDRGMYSVLYSLIKYTDRGVGTNW